MRRLSNEQLEKFPYPNLIAEFIESGYSIFTLGRHMGLPGRRKEDDPEIWGKLRGEIDIMTSEALGLSRLYNTSLDYLFSHELKVIDGRPYAYFRWLEWNQKVERELQFSKDLTEIGRALREKPLLLKVMETVLGLDAEQQKEFYEMIKEAGLVGKA